MHPPYSFNRSTWDNALISKKCDWSLGKASTTIIKSAAEAAKKDLHRSFLAPIVSNDGALKFKLGLCGLCGLGNNMDTVDYVYS